MNANRGRPDSNTKSSPTAQIRLAGPTAVGKSEVALLLAERLGGEIVSVDSMQVYRGLDIGTAKPGPTVRARVAHHLIDVADPNEPFDAARFVRLADQAIQDIRSRGRVPILCGGTGFYFKALLEGLGASPAGSPELRVELEATPLAELLRELAGKDPVAFERVDRRNPRRVIRAVEVIRLTGKRFSEMEPKRDAATADPAGEPQRVFGLARSSADLCARIDGRVDAMFERGLVAETQRLLDCGLASSKTAMQAIGYRQVVEHLRGERSLPDTIALIKQRTRQFARRQMTWFRNQLPTTWVQWNEGERADSVAGRLLEMLTGERP